MRTCDWGSSVLCGKHATWTCLPDKFPTYLFACDEHAPRMFAAELAKRLPSAPPLPLPDLKAFVTALAWASVLLRGTGNQLRAENARAAFRDAYEEYERRRLAAV